MALIGRMWFPSVFCCEKWSLSVFCGGNNGQKIGAFSLCQPPPPHRREMSQHHFLSSTTMVRVFSSTRYNTTSFVQLVWYKYFPVLFTTPLLPFLPTGTEKHWEAVTLGLLIICSASESNSFPIDFQVPEQTEALGTKELNRYWPFYHWSFCTAAVCCISIS